jgi:hypothetical protein
MERGVHARISNLKLSLRLVMEKNDFGVRARREMKSDCLSPNRQPLLPRDPDTSIFVLSLFELVLLVPPHQKFATHLEIASPLY